MRLLKYLEEARYYLSHYYQSIISEYSCDQTTQNSPRVKQRNVLSILSQCLEAKNQTDSSMRVTTKLDDFWPQKCIGLLCKSICQFSISVFPLFTSSPRRKWRWFFQLFCLKENFMSLKYNVKETVPIKTNSLRETGKRKRPLLS